MDIKDEGSEEIGTEGWEVDYAKWDKLEFARNLGEYLANHVPGSHEMDKHLIAMLAIEMDTYVKCHLAVQESGLVIEDSKGNAIGQSPYVKLMCRQMGLIRRLRRELKLDSGTKRHQY